MMKHTPGFHHREHVQIDWCLLTQITIAIKTAQKNQKYVVTRVAKNQHA